MRGLLVWVLIASAAVIVADDDGDVLKQTVDGVLGLEVRSDYLGDFGVGVSLDGQPESVRLGLTAAVDGEVRVLIMPGQFGGFDGGSISARVPLQFSHSNRSVVFDQLFLVPAERGGRAVIAGYDEHGIQLVTLTHLHVMLRQADDRIVVRHADLVAETALAEALGLPELAGMVIGSAWLDLPVAASSTADWPAVKRLRGELSCEGRPFWPQDGHVIDIALIGMDVVQYQGTDPDSGRIKLAPSATLENISAGDVPWIAKFDSNPAYPYSPPDQHPYLVWSLYRRHEGSIEQLGMSGVKHAFNTINVNCALNCSYLSGDILGPGCEDVYGASTNDWGTVLGPRDKVIASLGRFESTGSFFDTSGDGVQDNSSGEFENRLLVEPADLTVEGAEYFVSAWYVVQCDGDIFNSMGYRQVDPQPVNDGWSFALVGEFAQGPVIDSSLVTGGHGVFASHEVLTVASANPGGGCPEHMPQGYATLLARAEPLGDGQYRYRYALQNFDLDRGIAELIVPLAAGATVSHASVSAMGETLNWTVNVEPERVIFEGGGQLLPWLTLYNFEVVTDATPAPGELTLGLAGDNAPQTQTIAAIVPGDGLVFDDRFEE